MTSDTYRTAYATWQATHLPTIDNVSSLWDITQRAEHNDKEIGAVLTAYLETDRPSSPQFEGWNEAMSWVLLRDIQTLRRRLQTGRHQVATRALLDRTLALKNVWDLYRASVEV